jgi:signal transduction histidine kinase/CheY-like chemotaxis protein
MTESSTFGEAIFLSSAPAGRGERRLALWVGGVLLLLFAAALPFATQPLPRVPGFILVYETALVINDLVTAVLLFGQFGIGRSRALLVLGSAYLFTGFIAVLHALSFPGAFAPEGVIGGGSQTTVWLYMMWHAAFPLMVVAYALLKNGSRAARPWSGRPAAAIAAAVAAVVLLAAACAALATAGHEALPVLLAGNRYTPMMIVVVGGTWSCSLVAWLVLWARRPHSVLDLWLMVVLGAWIADVALSAVFNAGRYDLGFYFGRAYGLLAASFVLLVLLLENSRLYARLFRSHEAEQQRRVEAQRLGEQLAAANAQLADKNRQLEDASRLKSEFLSNMSHELRTPLNAVIGFSEIMKDGLAGELPPRQRGYAGHIYQSGQHLLALINDILDLSKIEAGKTEADLAPLELHGLLAESLVVVAEKARASRIRLHREPGSAVPAVLADRRRLKQILFNLLSNAVKFTPPDGRVSLLDRVADRSRAAQAMPGFADGMRLPLPDNEFQSFIEISVIDSGIGIGAADMKTLFTPFTQIDNALTRRIEGTGLGLAMVRRLAELHGGTVALTSEPGRGSCFTVWIPLRPAALERPAAEPEHAALALDDPSRPLALIVEDDDEAATLMQIQLEAEGFRVRRAASAEAALRTDGEEVPELITVDIVLPGIDGWQYIARLKDLPGWDQIPVVVVSVLPDHGDGFSLGASLVLQKPIRRDALSKGLARLGLVPSEHREVTVLVVDDDPVAVELLATHLREPGYVVLRAGGGQEGIDHARRFRPDLIALDLEMPHVNGFDVVRALADSEATSQIPIIVVTARQLTPELRQQLNGHIHDIIDKADMSRGHFIGEVRRAVSRRTGAGVPLH